MRSAPLTLPRPRNPLVRAAKFRQAGAHRASIRSCRQAAQRALRRELHTASDPRSP
jgi:hypothetical protein